MRRSPALLSALALIGCLSETSKTDPYSGMDCEQKIAAIVREIQAYQATQVAPAKVSAQSTGAVPADSAKPDSTVKDIHLFRGWPPVTGMNPGKAAVLMDVFRDEDDFNSDYSTPEVIWVPPVGFNPEGQPIVPLPDTLGGGPETTLPSTMPGSISAVQIVSSTAYRAHIRIFDRRDALVREFDQDFGYRGELDNPIRIVPKGYVSYLVWDNKDASGREVPSGVYLWRVRLTADSGTVTEMEAKIGYIGEECR